MQIIKTRTTDHLIALMVIGPRLDDPDGPRNHDLGASWIEDAQMYVDVKRRRHVLMAPEMRRDLLALTAGRCVAVRKRVDSDRHARHEPYASAIDDVRCAARNRNSSGSGAPALLDRRRHTRSSAASPKRDNGHRDQCSSAAIAKQFHDCRFL